MLEQGKLDVGLISSASFLANRDHYILLTNLGIGAVRKIMNVCLYTKCASVDLDNKTIALEDENTTSAMLLKVLCTHFWKVKPRFVTYSKHIAVEKLLEKYDAALVVGDACLTEKAKSARYVLDLGEQWYQCTQKPFVFSVFATRTESWMQEPERVQDFHQKLTLSYEYSQKHFDEILKKAKTKTKLSTKKLAEYYKALNYYLETEHFQGLEHFSQLSCSYEQNLCKTVS